MPVHDWTLVEAGIFHDFHVTWVPEIKRALNGGLLPSGFYALAEQHFGRPIADVLTLHASAPENGAPPSSGGIAVAQAPPRVRERRTVQPPALHALRRTLAIRHVSGHRLVAIIEIVSPANKDRPSQVEALPEKIMSAVDAGVHVQLVDLLPAGPHDPKGIHGAFLERMEPLDEVYELSATEPLTLVSYEAGPPVEVYLERTRVGAALPDMPLFLSPGRYINVPLESTYASAYRALPAFWRNVLERGTG